MKARIKHVPIMGGWYVVVGKYGAPLSEWFETREEAQQWMDACAVGRDRRAASVSMLEAA